MQTLEETMVAVSASILNLAPGPLAELRRMRPERTGAAIFWRMAAQFSWRDKDIQKWMQIIRILALLTPCGHRGSDVRLHEQRRRLGEVLCDGGDPAWGKNSQRPTPVLSEARLARFLALPTEQSGEALERIARMLAHTRSPQSGINCTEIAYALLDQDHMHTMQNVAKHYYARLDRAAYLAKQEHNQEEGQK